MLRNVESKDAPSLCEIYNHYIAHTVITFEENPVSPDEMHQRILNVTASFPWFVYEDQGNITGYAYATKWKERSAYRNSVEATVYLHPSATGKGIGSALLERLFAELRTRQVHAILGGVALPNSASVALLEKFGFQKVGHLKEVGFKFGQWIDVGYWQALL
ncbi:MAG TPA: arsinothricin resistance N-acetyltransferase ArsN1 family B [Terracidiphilus sp.]|nr:arsinothricin resistance N-acetyltransferase ArsN1 family B [Terracidiphilus sp.]